MNKYLAWLPVLMITGIFVYKPVKEACKEKPLSKSISFAVYKSISYTSEVYNNTSAQVHIIVKKASKKGSTIVCDTTFDSKMLKDYPSIDKAPYQKIIIPAVNAGKDHLEVKYILTYNSKGNELQMQDEIMVSDNGSTKLDIGI